MWTEYHEGFQRYSSAIGMQDPRQLADLLLIVAGPDVTRLSKTLNTTPRAEVQAAAAANGRPAVQAVPAETPYTALVRALTDYFLPLSNKEMCVITFHAADQHKDESIDEYYGRLQALAPGCRFPDVESAIKSQLIKGLRSRKLKQIALEKHTLTLAQFMEKARAVEATDNHLKRLEGREEKEESVNKLRQEKWHRRLGPPVNSGKNQSSKGQIDTSRFKGRDGNQRHQHQQNQYQQHQHQRHQNHNQHQHKPGYQSTNQKREGGKRNRQQDMCSFCGGDYHENGLDTCPARGAKCHHCHNYNHFPEMCRTRQHRDQSGPKDGGRRRVRIAADRDEADSDSDYDDYRGRGSGHRRLLSSHDSHSKTRQDPMIDLILNGKSCTFLPDSGANRSVINQETYRRIGQPPLRPTSRRIMPYKSTEPVNIGGVFYSKVSIPGSDRAIEEKFYVLGDDEEEVNILSCDAAKALRIIRFSNDVYLRLLSNEYKNGQPPKIGKMKNVKVKLFIDESIPPVAVPYNRTTALHLQEMEIREVQTLQSLDLIEDVTGPTPWISRTTFSPKPNGDYRYCIDSREINKAIRRQRYIMPTLEDILTQVTGSQVFSVLDLNSAYHQLELDEESRYITVFNTPLGLKQWKRLFFGLKSASDAFCNAVRQGLIDLEGVIPAMDDILVHGPTRAIHDDRLAKCKKRLAELNLTTKEEKQQIAQREVDFWGVVLTGNGVRMDPRKIEAVINCSRPEDTKALKSLNGMLSYCCRFIKNQATVTAPLRELARRPESEYKWEPEHEKAFQAAKDLLCSKVTLAYYDMKKPTVLITDASPVGVGAILSQVNEDGSTSIVAYASKALSPAESNYSQVEREAFGIVWACEKFRFYLIGCKFVCLTDNKALVHIFNNPSKVLSIRMSKFILRAQDYEMNVQHCPGESNAADYLSRHPNSKQQPRDSSTTRNVIRHLRSVIEYQSPNLVPPSEIADETAADPSLQIIINALFAGRDYNIPPHLVSYRRIFSELSYSDDGILLRGDRICIPTSLQRRVVRLAHEGHQGETRTKQILRSSVWFPEMDKLVEDVVKSCMPCQVSVPTKSRTPLIVTPLPDQPWQNLSADFYSVSNEAELLVVMDDYSKFPVVVEVTSTAFRNVKPELDSILSQYGIPEVIETDNGPPFNGEPFAEYAAKMGFRHCKITPLWPEANGEVERFMKTLGKCCDLS